MIKHPITARVCRYILKEKGLSCRALALLIKTHHKTVQRYLKGLHEPTPAIKQRMAKLMKVATYSELVTKAYIV